jgi:hypothetical protein
MAGHSRPKDGVLSHAYVPAIHVLLFFCQALKTWMPATSAGMTNSEVLQVSYRTADPLDATRAGLRAMMPSSRSRSLSKLVSS